MLKQFWIQTELTPCRNAIRSDKQLVLRLLLFGWFSHLGKEEFVIRFRQRTYNCIVVTNFQHKNIFFSKSQPLNFANFSFYILVKCIVIKKKDCRSHLYAYVPLTVTLKSDVFFLI